MTHLGSVEKAQIDAFSALNLGVSDIAKRVNRHKSTVTRYLQRRKTAKERKLRQRVSKLSERDTRRIIQTAVNGRKSATDVQKELNLNVTTRRIQQVLRECPHTAFLKPQKAPYLLKRHKQERLKWAETQLDWDGPDWRRVIFSDEKKFNLDGPDGLSAYWHDLRRAPNMFSTRHQGGKSLMVWGAVSYNGVLSLVGIEGTLDARYYCDVLDQGLLKQAEAELGDIWTFVHDNASVHSADYTKNWLAANDVHTLDWPAKSPDLNIIENVWGLLARKVYAQGRQYQNVEDLADAVLDCWNNFDRSYIRTLYKSIPRRLISVIKKKGGNTDY